MYFNRFATNTALNNSNDLDDKAELPKTFLSLPVSLIVQILAKLDNVSDLARCRATCQLLRSIVAEEDWCSAKTFVAPVHTQNIQKVVQWAVKHCSRLQQINLAGSAVELGDIVALSGLPLISELNLSGCWRLQPRSRTDLSVISQLFYRWRYLSKLDMSGTFIARDALLSLSRHMPPQLRQLNLSSIRPHHLSLNDICWVSQCFPTLQDLDLSGIVFAQRDMISPAQRSSLQPLQQVPFGRDLQVLSFRGCTFKLTLAVGSTISQATCLKSLDLSQSDVYTHDVCIVVSRCQQLRSLSITNTRVEGTILRTLAIARNQLTALEIGQLEGLHDDDCAYFFASPTGRRLELLEISACTAIKNLSLLPPLQSLSLNQSVIPLEGFERGSYQRLTKLDLSHVHSLSGRNERVATALKAILGTVTTLKDLKLDSCYVGFGVLSHLCSVSPPLVSLSCIGCGGATDKDWQLCALSFPSLKDLSVGGSFLSWREEHSLTAFTNLQSLCIMRRGFLTDEHLKAVLQTNNKDTLRSLTLAACPGLNGSAFQDTSLVIDTLRLTLCDRMTGKGIVSLKKLRNLELHDCPAVKETALQAICIACTQLTRLQLPSHINATTIPTGGSLQRLRVLRGRRAVSR